MSYSIENFTEDCYEGTSCLRNKLGIKDEKQLNEFEAAVTFAKSSNFISESVCSTFDVNHYKRIHQYLFEDIYEWAGHYRTVDISKKGTVFAPYNQIEVLMSGCFKRLKDKDYFQNMEFENFIENLVDFYYVTNIIHPFREGNGRTQRVFLTQLVNLNNYEIDFSKINSDELMIATIHSANGVNDYLKNIFKIAIHK